MHDLFDHPVYFRETRSPYRPVAIVGQPYKTDVISARVTAMQIGLDLHVAPKRTASWWLPGSTAFFCFTRLEEIVRFLPDQCCNGGDNLGIQWLAHRVKCATPH